MRRPVVGFSIVRLRRKPAASSSTCPGCGREMSPPQPCGVTTLLYDDGEPRQRIALGDESADWWVGNPPHTACHDCKVVTGQIDHIGCDMEQCPKCQEQLLGCACEIVGER